MYPNQTPSPRPAGPAYRQTTCTSQLTIFDAEKNETKKKMNATTCVCVSMTNKKKQASKVKQLAVLSVCRSPLRVHRHDER